MISFALATALALSAVQTGPPPQLRTAFADCLSRFAKSKMTDKLEDAAFRSELKSACTAQEAAFRNGIVQYDVKMGAKKASAEEGASMEIEDYFTNTVENYLLHTKGPTKKD